MKLRSASNRQETLLRKLNRKKYRQQEQLFLLEGARAVQQVIDNRLLSINTLFFDETQEYWLQEQWKEAARQVDSFTLSRELFAEVSDTDTPQGVLALCQMPEEKTVDQLSTQKGIIVAFDAVQDPGNLGTIIRTASWFGAKGLVSGKGTVDMFHPKVVRGTAGATGALPHINGELSELLIDFEAAGWSILLLDAGENAVPLTELRLPEKAILVVGNEAHGVSSELIKGSRRRVRISPGIDHPPVESLNAAVATSVALYDLTGKKGQL